MDREKDIERYLARCVKALGGIAYKFTSPGHAGAPDRLVCLPGGRAWFVELKAPGRQPRPAQWVQIERLRALGFPVFVIDSREGVNGLLRRMEGDADGI